MIQGLESTKRIQYVGQPGCFVDEIAVNDYAKDRTPKYFMHTRDEGIEVLHMLTFQNVKDLDPVRGLAVVMRGTFQFVEQLQLFCDIARNANNNEFAGFGNWRSGFAQSKAALRNGPRKVNAGLGLSGSRVTARAVRQQRCKSIHDLLKTRTPSCRQPPPDFRIRRISLLGMPGPNQVSLSIGT